MIVCPTTIKVPFHGCCCGATVAATRDYHPVDHASFLPSGPFPCHCVQGTDGSKFMPEIADSLAAAKRMASGRVHVAFKAMHEHVDSFGALPYDKFYQGGKDRICRSGTLAPSAAPPSEMKAAVASRLGQSLMLRLVSVAP